jgi:hypothetical protein
MRQQRSDAEYYHRILNIDMEAIRAEVVKYFPFLREKCDIDICLAYDAMMRPYGYHIQFPKRPQASSSGYIFPRGRPYGRTRLRTNPDRPPHWPLRPPPETGVLVGTIKSRRLVARRSQVRFNYVYLTN